ncbi:hypothetical protein F3Y22_tig00110694pilonHSYRG00234 [Hibiscus syriacus]|uniref:Uncharacterized protein n=1 Tax=Hibiscus syriacus TaxID=106335 RepID=A0A6A2ZUP9_HIBSY|nr:hypothetical protein F3Y22_tig00110694pilonHSYRG00234 [Hibiscus syriacus]
MAFISLDEALIGPVKRESWQQSFWSVRQRRRGSTEASTTAGRDIWLGLLEAVGGVGRLELTGTLGEAMASGS